MNDSILILGHPGSGKTTFIVQFYNRIKQRKSEIKITKTPENIKAITDAVKRLAMGEEPIPTSADDNLELVLPIMVGGKNIDLVCPDYGGEQVNDITEFMDINGDWENLLNSSNRWILFIRPHDISPEYDLSLSCYEEITTEKPTISLPPGLSAQSKYIELLQALLYAKNIGVKHPIAMPTLSIVLTCWDELNTDANPVQVLQETLPMFFHFIETIWDYEALSVCGLAAQEFPLKTEAAKDRYRKELPENFGYIIDKEGKRNNDITTLVKIALR